MSAQHDRLRRAGRRKCTQMNADCVLPRELT